jgi:general secretion pathway protein G
MELMVVIIILGLLVGLVGPTVIERFKSSKRKIACIDMNNIVKSIEMFEIENNRLPDDLEELWNPGSEEDAIKYLDAEPIDPWGNPYSYIPESAGEYELLCLGSDGQEGGEGEKRDITKEEALSEFRKKRE